MPLPRMRGIDRRRRATTFHGRLLVIVRRKCAQRRSNRFAAIAQTTPQLRKSAFRSF
jgi:hypothetical protein